jgi:hypothetical protein
MRQIQKGATDQAVVVRIIDSGDGTPETGVVFNTSGIDLWYRREGATKTSITEATLSALNDAHSDGGVLHIGDGYYRLDLPDAAVASGANGVQIGGTVTGMIVIGCYVHLVDFNPQDAVRQGMTALPNAAADAAGGLPISDAGGLDLDAQVGTKINDILTDTGTTLQAEVDGIQADTEDIQARLPAALTADGNIKADTLRIGGTLQTANDVGADVNDILVDTAEIGAAGAGLTNINLPNQTMDITGNITGNLSGSVGSVTGAVGSVTAGVTLAASAVQAIWDALTALTTVGSIGKLLVDNVNATISSRATQTSVDDLPTNAELATSQAAADDATLAAIAALNNISAAQVNAEVDTALADIHLDHLLAATYDPASKPGAADALLNELVESDGGVARYTANALEQAPTGGSAPTAEEIADEVRVELTTELGRIDVAVSTRATPAQVATELGTYDGPTNAEMVARTLAAASYATAAAQATVQTSVDDVPTTAEFEARTIAAASYATAANLTTVDGVVDAILALLDDPRGEPAQGAPGVSVDAVTKLDYLYKLARNKIEQTATDLKVYNDAGSVVDHKAPVSDDGTTYTRGEFVSGP